MSLRVIGRDEVRRLLPMSDCIEVMARALETLGRNEAVNPLRTMLLKPDRSGLLGMMPAYLTSPPAIGMKAVTVFPGNHGTELDSHQGVVLLFEPERGELLAVVEAGEITAIRTAAVSGLATRLLARPEACDLAILGSGVQARTHLEAMAVVRDLRRVRVWSRTAAHAEAFARSEALASGPTIEAIGDAEEAVRGADLICTTTAAREPILEGAWLAPGAHVNAVGSSVRTARELDGTAVARSRLFVDRRESALAEAGDFLIAMEEGVVGVDHIVAELGELLTGADAGRRSPEEITLFKSLGLGVEDLAAAEHVYRQALSQGGGAEVEFAARVHRSGAD